MIKLDLVKLCTMDFSDSRDLLRDDITRNKQLNFMLSGQRDRRADEEIKYNQRSNTLPGQKDRRTDEEFPYNQRSNTLSGQKDRRTDEEIKYSQRSNTLSGQKDRRLDEEIKYSQRSNTLSSYKDRQIDEEVKYKQRSNSIASPPKEEFTEEAKYKQRSNSIVSTPKEEVKYRRSNSLMYGLRDEKLDEVKNKTSNSIMSSMDSLAKFHLDGPISLLETTYNCKMESDTGQRPDSMKSSQSMNGQPNGDVNFDQLCNMSNLKEDDLLPRIKEIVMALKGLEDYDRGEGMKLVKSIGDTYWSHKGIRHKIGHVLKENDFAEISMKMLTNLNKKGIFKNDGIWFPTYYTLNTLWNYSDASLELAKSLAEHGGVKFFTVNCKHKPYIDNMSSKNVFYVVKSSMSILHNIARNSDVQHYFKENGTSDVMIHFLQSKDDQEMLKIMAMLTLAHIVDEEENEKLIDDTGAIDGIVNYMKLALDNSGGRYKGFTPTELLDGLSKLAVNDKNKNKIIDAGALPLLLKMLKKENVEEQTVAAKAVWSLSFDKDVAQKIREFEDIMPTLEKLASSPDKNVEKNVKGVLFVLKGENDVKNRPKSSSKRNKKHVFISYSWSEKEPVYKLKDRLKQEGLEVWIDVERMGGSTLSAMAEAVENASVVLICMSEKYKLSPNCRLEAEYTFQMRKDYIPLMMQKQYRPDGWLGAILGAKLYFDFSGKYPFEKPWAGLHKELKGMGKLGEIADKKADSLIISSSSSSTTTAYAAPPTSTLLKMNNDDVSEWLCSHKLDGCVPYFAQFNGKLLDQLKKMKDEAPEFYYQCLERSLKMNLVEILTFTEALQQL